MTMTQAETKTAEREPFYRTPPVVETLGHALAALRQEQVRAAEKLERTGDDDYWTCWTRDVLERRPIVVIGVLRLGATDLWLIEPGEDDVFHVNVHHTRHEVPLPNGDTMPRDVTDAEIKLATKAHADALNAISWLVKDLTGEQLDELGRGPVG